MIVPGAVRRTRMRSVKMQKLGGTDAFIVFDLEGAAYNVGVTRLAPKILVDGATLLARSTTYLFASFEQQVTLTRANEKIKQGRIDGFWKGVLLIEHKSRDRDLDKAVDAAYGKTSFKTEAERVAFLFGLYQNITTPLQQGAKP